MDHLSSNIPPRNSRGVLVHVPDLSSRNLGSLRKPEHLSTGLRLYRSGILRAAYHNSICSKVSYVPLVPFRGNHRTTSQHTQPRPLSFSIINRLIEPMLLPW